MKLEGTITEENINQNLLKVNYAVRGPIVERAAQIETELEKVFILPLIYHHITNEN
jgi:hypothetical protein